MAKLPKSLYVIVQHSGYGYGHKPGFEKGLEMRTITTVGELRIVQRSDGITFDDYVAADEYCEKEMGIDGPGLYPAAKGSFSRNTIDGLAIYQPNGKAGSHARV